MTLGSPRWSRSASTPPDCQGGFCRGIGKGHRVLIPRLELPSRRSLPSGRLTRGGVPVLNRRRGSPSFRRQSVRRPGSVQPVGAGVLHAVTDDGTALQIGAGGQTWRPSRRTPRRWTAPPAETAPPSVRSSTTWPCLHRQVVLALQGALHPLLVLPAVRLGPEGPDGRALAAGSAAGTGCSIRRRPWPFRPPGRPAPGPGGPCRCRRWRGCRACCPRRPG